MTRRVLMMAYWFPPCVRWPTAAARAAGFARYLRKEGWEPVVLAPDLSGGICFCGGCGEDGGERNEAFDGVETIRLPVALRRGVALARSLRSRNSGGKDEGRASPRPKFETLALFFEVKTDWVALARERGELLVSEGAFDAIWTTSPPFETLRVGSHLTRRTAVPWVADLRDEISRIHGQRPLAEKAAMVRRRILRRDARRAAAVVAVTPTLAEVDSSWLGREVVAIPSGYDPRAWPASADREPSTNERFTLVYAGKFYEGYRVPDPALLGMRSFIRGLPASERDSVRFVYYGRDGDFLRLRAAALGLLPWVEDRGFVVGSTLRYSLISADVLLLLTNVVGHDGVPGGKFYDYLAAGRPILAVPGGDDFVDEALRSTRAGLSASEPREIAEALAHWYESWRTAGRVPSQGLPEAAAAYSIDTSARRLASLLDRVTAERSP